MLRYDGEIHLVHYDASFDSFGDALTSGAKDALLVLGLFVNTDGFISDDFVFRVSSYIMLLSSTKQHA